MNATVPVRDMRNRSWKFLTASVAYDAITFASIGCRRVTEVAGCTYECVFPRIGARTGVLNNTGGATGVAMPAKFGLRSKKRLDGRCQVKCS